MKVATLHVLLTLTLASPSAAWLAGPLPLRSTSRPSIALCSVDDELGIEFESEEQKKEAVGNLVADDEWNGLTMELSELVRTAVVEDMKTNAREFLGKDDYQVGDFSKQVDTRVKEEIAKMRQKDECT